MKKVRLWFGECWCAGTAWQAGQVLPPGGKARGLEVSDEDKSNWGLELSPAMVFKGLSSSFCFGV